MLLLTFGIIGLIGHLSHSRMKMLDHFIPYSPCNSNSIYTIFPLARQHKLPFSPSISISKSLFDLIHCDLWGPFFVKSNNNSSYFHYKKHVNWRLFIKGVKRQNNNNKKGQEMGASPPPPNLGVAVRAPPLLFLFFFSF